MFGETVFVLVGRKERNAVIMNEKTRKLVSAVLASVMVITTTAGIALAQAAPAKAADEMQMILADAGKNRWQARGDGNTATDNMFQDTVGGVTIASSSTYGFGSELQTPLQTDEISFDLRFDQQTLASGDHFTLVLGNDSYVFDPTNAAETRNGVSFLLYKKAEAAIHSATDPAATETWRDFPFQKNNRFTIKKGDGRWELYLKNSVITTPALIGAVSFATVPEAVFDNNKAKLSVYVAGGTPTPYSMSVTNITAKCVPEKGDMILTDKGAPTYVNAKDEAGIYDISPVENGINAKGTAAFAAGVMSPTLDASSAVSFRLKFNQDTLPTGSWFAFALAGDGYDFSADFNNDTNKGVTFLTYRQAENAVQFPGNNAWTEFIFTEDNLITIKKGDEAWEIYLQNSVKKTAELVGSVPYSTVGKDIFNGDTARLAVYAFAEPAVDIDMNITYLTQTQSKDSGAGLPIVYPEKTYIIPTNAGYWRNDANCTVNADGVSVGTAGGIGNATYTGSRLKDRLAQVELETAIPDGSWVGLLMRQSKAGAGMWDQERVYWFMLYPDGKVELRKNMEVLATADASRFLSAGRMNKTTVRFGAVDEIVGGKEYVRLILDIGGQGVINYLDKDAPFLDHGYSGFYTNENATARVYTGPEGTDEDKDDIKTGFGEGGGYLGGEINPDFLIQFPNFKDFTVDTPNSSENQVLPDEIYQEIDMDELLARVKQLGNGDVVFATATPPIIPKAVFEALQQTEKNLVIKVVDKEGFLLYSFTINGRDVTEPADCNMALQLDEKAVDDIKKLVPIQDITMLDFAQKNAFPGKMSVKIALNDSYQPNEALSLYYFNGKDAITLITKDVKVNENGYIKISTTDADGLFLTNEDKDFTVKPIVPNPGDENGKTGVSSYLAIALLLMALASGTACITLNCKKRGIHS